MQKCIKHLDTPPKKLTLYDLANRPENNPRAPRRSDQILTNANWCVRHWISRGLWTMEKAIFKFHPISLSEKNADRLYNSKKLSGLTPPIFKVESQPGVYHASHGHLTEGKTTYHVSSHLVDEGIPLPTMVFLTIDLENHC